MSARRRVLAKRSDVETALATARRMLDRQLDPHRLALSFAYLYERNTRLEAVLTRLDHYLRYGMNEHDLAELTREVESLREEGTTQNAGATLEI
jgi:hypothetical protein